MAEAIRKPQVESSSDDDNNDVVNLSNSSTSEDNCGGYGADSDTGKGKDEGEGASISVSLSAQQDGGGVGGEGRMKLCVKMDPCLLCSQPAVGYDSEGKLMKKMRQQHASQRPQFNYTRLFGFLCKGLSIKSYYGMVKADWNFGSGACPFPFCERCESLINTLAGVYTRLESVKTELKERMLDGEEVYMKDELYSKQDVRFYNFRKLVLGVDFKGTVKGRMFQTQPNSDGYAERPTCFDESMFPPNHPGSSWATANPKNPALVDDDHDGDDECGSSSSADGHSLAKKPKVGTSLFKAATATLAAEAGSSLSLSSSLPVIKRKLAKAKRKGASAPIFTPETSGFMERCGETGKITYYSGAGVDKEKEGVGGSGANSGTTPSVPPSTRRIIVFAPTPQEDQYQCTECGELVPLLRVRKIQQQQLFRHHFLKFHTDRFKCKICRGSSSKSVATYEPMDKEELVAHLETQHEIIEWSDYLKICQQQQGRIKCPTCGKLVKGGKGMLILHMKTHDARPFICSVCGQSYQDKCDCNGHMEKEHPGGKWDRFVCKYPGCTSSLEGELGLRKHIQEEHGDCEEARRLMCFECGKVFNIAHGVKRHVKTVHEGVLEFECSQCSRK
ncbi:unnamed protein product [Orchesella dallaii]|uniref:C2H2-type domain-containing protein n=1 Tax=Orchesella dallaii TaxID=48710 RepID=A0ABP1RUW0_9HEXA